MLPILYSFRRCPYAMRARLAIACAGIEIEHREILLKDKPQAMLHASPKGTVPVLILKNGQVIDESLDIMLWVLNQHNPSDWLAYQGQALALIHCNDTEFKPWLDKYKYANRFPEHSECFYRQQSEYFLQILERRLQQQHFLLADHPTLADYAIFPFIRQFANVNKVWFEHSRYERLQQWLTYHCSSPLFITIMKKKPMFVEHI